MYTERNQFKQQCTQAIRKWDQAIRERNDYKDQYAKVKRQHEDAIKEINQNMNVRIKAGKDIKRLTDERNAAMQEYSMIMSERDTFHKEMEKLQDEVQETRKSKKAHDEDRRKLNCQIEMLKREVEQSLQERDKAMRENHDLRDRIGAGSAKSLSDVNSGKSNRGGNRFELDKHKKVDRDSASNEMIDSGANSEVDSKLRVDNLDQANVEIERLRKIGDKLSVELQGKIFN